jgi:hypothetical protein
MQYRCGPCYLPAQVPVARLAAPGNARVILVCLSRCRYPTDIVYHTCLSVPRGEGQQVPTATTC